MTLENDFKHSRVTINLTLEWGNGEVTPFTKPIVGFLGVPTKCTLEWGKG